MDVHASFHLILGKILWIEGIEHQGSLSTEIPYEIPTTTQEISTKGNVKTCIRLTCMPVECFNIKNVYSLDRPLRKNLLTIH